MSEQLFEAVDWSQVPTDLKFPIKENRSQAEEKVKEWSGKMKPLLLRDGKLMRCKCDCDDWKESFSWAAKATKEVTDVEEVGRVWTLHTWAYYGFFKPTIAEVLSQVPEELLEEADFFLLRGPDHAADLNATWKYVNDGYHVAQCILYKKVKK